MEHSRLRQRQDCAERRDSALMFGRTSTPINRESQRGAGLPERAASRRPGARRSGHRAIFFPPPPARLDEQRIAHASAILSIQRRFAPAQTGRSFRARSAPARAAALRAAVLLPINAIALGTAPRRSGASGLHRLGEVLLGKKSVSDARHWPDCRAHRSGRSMRR